MSQRPTASAASPAPAAATRARRRGTRPLGGSADAQLAATLEATAGPHAVLTSDEPDVRRAADHVGVAATVVTV
jgi:hypothetical protein